MGKKGKNNVVDGLKPSEMSRPQLLGYIVRLQAELHEEREERNYYMLEREKFYQLWNLLLEQIQLEKEKASLMDAHMQDVEKAKDEEDNLYNQKLRFLKQEQARKLGQVRLFHLQKMKHIQDDAWAVLMVMREALMNKKKEIRRAQMAFYQIIRGLHWQHSKEISDLRSEFAREIRRLETQFDRRVFENNDKREEEQDREVAKLNDTKETQLHKLIESHRFQIKELQKFFRDLIRHNLTLIYGMKDAAKKQKSFELRARKDFELFKQKYDKYVSSALKWKADMERWEVEHEDDLLESLLEELRTTNDEAKRLRHSQRMMECSNETLRQELMIAEKEKDNLRKEFSRSIVDVQKRTSMNRFVLQIKQKAAKREQEIYKALADNIEKDEDDELDYYAALLSSREREKDDIKQEIIEIATEHKNTEVNYKEAFLKNEINLSDIGYPIKKTGARARGHEEDVLVSADYENKMSKRHRASTSRAHNSIGGGTTRKSIVKSSAVSMSANSRST